MQGRRKRREKKGEETSLSLPLENLHESQKSLPPCSQQFRRKEGEGEGSCLLSPEVCTKEKGREEKNTKIVAVAVVVSLLFGTR